MIGKICYAWMSVKIKQEDGKESAKWKLIQRVSENKAVSPGEDELRLLTAINQPFFYLLLYKSSTSFFLMLFFHKRRIKNKKVGELPTYNPPPPPAPVGEFRENCLQKVECSRGRPCECHLRQANNLFRIQE